MKIIDFPFDESRKEIHDFARRLINSLTNSPVGCAIVVWDKDNYCVAQQLVLPESKIPLLLVPDFTKSALTLRITEQLAYVDSPPPKEGA